MAFLKRKRRMENEGMPRMEKRINYRIVNEREETNYLLQMKDSKVRRLNARDRHAIPGG